jgi:hypothetical protein
MCRLGVTVGGVHSVFGLGVDDLGIDDLGIDDLGIDIHMRGYDMKPTRRYISFVLGLDAPHGK